MPLATLVRSGFIAAFAARRRIKQRSGVTIFVTGSPAGEMRMWLTHCGLSGPQALCRLA